MVNPKLSPSSGSVVARLLSVLNRVRQVTSRTPARAYAKTKSVYTCTHTSCVRVLMSLPGDDETQYRHKGRLYLCW